MIFDGFLKPILLVQDFASPILFGPVPDVQIATSSFTNGWIVLNSGTDLLVVPIDVPSTYHILIRPMSGLCRGIDTQFLWLYMVLTYLHFRIFFYSH